MHRIKIILAVGCFLIPELSLATEPDTALAFQLMRDGQFMLERDQVDSALTAFSSSSEILEQTDLKDDLANVYLWISACHYEKSDCELDQLFAERALDLKKAVHGEFSTEAAGITHDLGVTYFGCQQEEKGFDRLKKAKAIFEKSGPENAEKLANVNGSIGWQYGVKFQYDSAFVYLKEAFEVRKKLLGYWDLEVASSAHMIGYFSIYAGKFEQADEHVRMGLEIREKLLGPNHHETAQSWQKMGECQLYQRKYYESLPFFQKALEALSGRNDLSADLSLNPEISEVKDLPVLRSLLSMKANAFHYHYLQNRTDSAALRNAKTTNDLAIATSDQLQEYFTSRRSRASALSRNTDIIARALLIEGLLYDLNQDPEHLTNAHQLMEKSRNSLLRLSIMDDEAVVSAGLPQDLISELDSLGQALASADYNLTLLEPNDSSGAEKRKLALDLRLKYDSMMKGLEADFPDYHTLKFSLETPHLKEIQKNLKTGDLVVSYFESSRFLIMHCITQDSVWMKSKNRPTGFDQLVLDFARSMSEPNNYTDDLQASAQSFQANGKQLFDILLGDVIDPDSSGNLPTELIIIPDGILSYLPFGTFIVEADSTASDFRELDYLLKHTNLRYAFSASPNFNQRNDKIEAEYGMVSFVPDYEAEHSELQPLEGAKAETDALKKLVGGLQFVGSEANRTSFFEYGTKAKILHLAMHTEVDDKQPMRSHFSFTGTSEMRDQLLAHELFNLNLAADMAVLSGCQTGIGKISKGEGVISLSRAFTYAGCPSIVMTLWMTDDNANHQIIESFYTNLKEGETRSQSLRKAKLDYLSSADAVSAHPSYWAPFVLVGEAGTLDLDDSNAADHRWKILVGIGCLILLISGVRNFLARA